MNHHDIIAREMPAWEKVAYVAVVLTLTFSFTYGCFMIAEAVIKRTV